MASKKILKETTKIPTEAAKKPEERVNELLEQIRGKYATAVIVGLTADGSIGVDVSNASYPSINYLLSRGQFLVLANENLNSGPKNA